MGNEDYFHIYASITRVKSQTSMRLWIRKNVAIFLSAKNRLTRSGVAWTLLFSSIANFGRITEGGDSNHEKNLVRDARWSFFSNWARKKTGGSHSNFLVGKTEFLQSVLVKLQSSNLYFDDGNCKLTIFEKEAHFWKFLKLKKRNFWPNLLWSAELAETGVRKEAQLLIWSKLANPRPSLSLKKQLSIICFEQRFILTISRARLAQKSCAVWRFQRYFLIGQVRNLKQLKSILMRKWRET